VEPFRPVSDSFLLVRRKFPKFIIPLSDQIPLLRGELMPPLNLVLGLFALVGGHALPAICPSAQPILPFGGKGIPAVFEGFKGLLLLRAQPFPGTVRRLGPGEGSEAEEQNRDSPSNDLLHLWLPFPSVFFFSSENLFCGDSAEAFPFREN